LVTRYENAEKFKIIAGERRFRAARSLGWLEIECKILNKDENDTYKLAIIENLQRENLSPFEEADSIALLKEKFAYTDEELSHVLGKSRSYTTEILSIVSLPKPELQACKESGMNTKNLLIQASLAYKKGIFSDFLQSYKTGEWKTVKDAKSFNQQTTKKAQLTKKDNSKSIINESISLKKNQIHITCKDEKSALKAFETIKESIKQYLK
jgi:ParB family chromosome partitioning protein